MELVDKGDVVRFIGGVVLTRGNDILRADRMETNKHRDKVFANGRVHLFRKMLTGEKLNAYGDQGFFNTESGDGYLESRSKPAHLVYDKVLSSTATRELDIYADRFDFSQVRSTGVATGNVTGSTIDPNTGDHFQFWTSSADIDQGDQTVRLYGPVVSKIRQETAKGYRTIEGDVITLKSDDRTMLAEGNARAIFYDDVEKKETARGAHRP